MDNNINTDNTEKYFDINIAASILGINPMTLRRAIKGNKITYKIVTENYQKKYLMSYKDLESYITYNANNNVYNVDQLKLMKENLIKHKQNNLSLSNKSLNTFDDGKSISDQNLKIKEDKIKEDSLCSNDYIIELFKQQESFIEKKIEQYENKIKSNNELLESLKKKYTQTKSVLDQKNTQLALSVKKNSELKDEIQFLKDDIKNNLILIKDMLSKIKTERKINQYVNQIDQINTEHNEEEKTQVIYLDIINF